MDSLSSVADQPQFEFTGGILCLDFVNTLEGRIRQPGDLLPSYGDLLAWTAEAGIASPSLHRRLLNSAAQHPRNAEGILQRAHALREALYGMFSAIAAHKQPPADDLALLNRELASFLGNQVRLAQAKQGICWQWQGDESALDQLLWPVAESAAHLLTSPDLMRVRECAASDCAWLFLDHSHNRSRRWCDMKVCGNRSKVKSYYARRQRGKSARSAAKDTNGPFPKARRRRDRSAT